MPRIIIRSLAFLILAAFAIVGTGCYSTPEGGQIGVVRNGGPFDNKSIRQTVCPGAGNTWVGWGSNTHFYPDSSSQRTFKFNEDRDADANPIANLRTKDGVKVTLSGTVYFKTGFDCSAAGKELIKKFDQANVNRPEGQRPWEDFPGWLANQWKPILDANAREVVSSFECKDVVSSCALLARDGGDDEEIKSADNKSNVQQIEQRLEDGLTTQLKAKLGADFFTGIEFNMEQPLLPEVDDAIASAQRSYAKVADVKAERLKQEEQVKVEKQKKLVNQQKQQGYVTCPSCARQDEFRALPKGLQTYAPGANFAVGSGK